MKKQYIITFLALFVLVGLVWFVADKKKSGDIVSAPTDTNDTVATTSEEAVPGVFLDHSKLTGKDRLYTEEEGRYENLNKEEKKLLRTILTLPECKTNTEGVYCGDNENTIQNSLIVALYNDYALVSFPTVKASNFYKLYDIKQQKLTSNFHYGNKIKNKHTLVLIDSASMYYYKAGMSNLVKINTSELFGSKTYVKSEGIIDVVEVSFINESTIKASIFDSARELYSDGTRKKIEEKILAIP